MASKRLNMFYENKKQETTEITLYCYMELYCDYPQSLMLKMASKRRNMFHKNKKQEATEIVGTNRMWLTALVVLWPDSQMASMNPIPMASIMTKESASWRGPTSHMSIMKQGMTTDMAEVAQSRSMVQASELPSPRARPATPSHNHIASFSPTNFQLFSPPSNNACDRMQHNCVKFP
ncbi:hypothetical protein AAG570_010496 [Ranatra chinensis]|uniref:Uncharacterized protein n=1 Tax=Ranatra chinensis TaxID=642074 RepID=A0ABD0YMQ2_9HEMI